MVFLESVKPTIDNLINKNNGGQDSRLEKYIRISMQILAFILILGNLAGNTNESNQKSNYSSTHLKFLFHIQYVSIVLLK